MLAMIEHGTAKSRRFSYSIETVNIGGLYAVRFIFDIPGNMNARRCEKYIAKMCGTVGKIGCSEVIFRNGFPFKEQMRRRGFLESAEDAFKVVLAGEITSSAVSDRDCVLLVSDRYSPDAVRTLKKLISDFRRVEICSPKDVFEKFADTAWKSGVSLAVFNPERTQDYSAAVIMSKPQTGICLNEKCIYLTCADNMNGDKICGGRKIKKIVMNVPERFSVIPQGYPECAIISKALECGILKENEIKICDVEI